MKTKLLFSSLILAVIAQLFLSSCAEDLYKLNQPNGVARTIMFKPDSANTLLALTPLRGPNAEFILQAKEFLDIQETTNYEQSLPKGIDVLYLNADYADFSIGRSKLLIDALDKGAYLLVDGSPAKLEAFCKETMPFYFPEAQMIAYSIAEPDSTTEQMEAFQTIVFSPKDNILSKGMLLETLWKYVEIDENDKKFVPPLSGEDSNDNTRMNINSVVPAPTNLRMDNLAGCSNDGTPVRVGDFSKTENIKLHVYSSTVSNWAYNELFQNIIRPCSPTNIYGNFLPEYFIKATNGCHFLNEVINKNAAYYWNDRYPSGSGLIQIRRVSNWDGYESDGVRFGWISPIFTRKDPNTEKRVATSRTFRFDRESCRSCYLDMNIISSRSKTFEAKTDWGVKLGFSFSSGATIPLLGSGVSITFGVMAGYVGSYGKSQTVTVSKSSQREFWVNTCMFKTANKGVEKGSTIYGKVYANVLGSYRKGNYEFNAYVPYVTQQEYPNFPRYYGYVSSCIRQNAPDDVKLKFYGDIVTGRYVYVYSKWYDKLQRPISTFKNCR
jgi:hypothetical protein